MYFKKTEKGQAEIEGGARQLAQRLRMVLVLVDGRRSAAELRQMLDAATPEALRALLDDGYIAAVPMPERRAGGSRRRNDHAPAAADSIFKASAMPSRFDVALRPPGAAATDKERSQIERSLKRALGVAAAGLIESVQQARTVDELIDVLKKAQRAIANARGPEIAEEFASRYGGLDES